MNRLSRFDCDGALDAPIVVGAPSQSGLMIVEAGSITQNGSVTLDSGNIRRVKVYGDIAAPSSGVYTIVASTGRVIFVETDDKNAMTATADLLGGVQSVSDRIQAIDIDGNIGSNSVTTKITASNFIYSVEAEAIWADFVVELSSGALDGNFWHMETRSGDFNGSIRAGKINESATNGGTFTVAGDWSADVTLGSDIRTAININGNLLAGSVWNVGGALLSQVPTGGDPNVGAITVTGDLLGSLTFGGSVRGPIVVIGNVGAAALIDIGSKIESGTPNEYEGSLTIGGSMLGELTAGGVVNSSISIGDDFSGTIAIENSKGGGLPSGALSGQITINENNTASDWLGDVVLGTISPITLGPTQSGDNESPYYGVLSSEIGGGAIGLVPFNFHPKDSEPDHGTSLVNTPPTSVTIHHYGPVADGDGDLAGTPPVRVFEANMQLPVGHVPHKDSPICDAIWTEFDLSGDFIYAINGRVVTITNGNKSFSSNRVYKIIPADLVCGSVPNNPGVIFVSDWVGTQTCTGEALTDAYGFRVVSGFDLNMNLTFDTGDIETWLASPVDLDDDNDADALDLILLVDVVTTGVGE